MIDGILFSLRQKLFVHSARKLSLFCCKAFPCLRIDLLIKSSQRKFIVICILYTVLPSLNFTLDFSLKYLAYPLAKTTHPISQIFGRIKITAFESHRDLALRAAF